MEKVEVGLCGFSMAMSKYAREFHVVEIQNTFYDPPSDASLQKWRSTTGPQLDYVIKVWQMVTHLATSPTYRRMRRKLGPNEEPGFFAETAAVEEGWLRSLECANLLSAKAMLFQCPASFRPQADHVAQLRSFFTRIHRPSAALLWEPRGPAWVAEKSLAINLCSELDLVHVIDPFVTPPEKNRSVYWRLHGIGSSYRSYTDAELVKLREMLVSVEPKGVAFVMFNNVPRMDDARRFCSLMY